MPSSTSYADDDLVPLGVGARIVGVSNNTLRTYADAGKVPVVRTPTNQRRFRVGDLRALLRPEVDEPTAAAG